MKLGIIRQNKGFIEFIQPKNQGFKRLPCRGDSGRWVNMDEFFRSDGGFCKAWKLVGDKGEITHRSALRHGLTCGRLEGKRVDNIDCDTVKIADIACDQGQTICDSGGSYPSVIFGLWVGNV